MMKAHVNTRRLNTISAGRKGTIVGLLGGRQFQDRLVSMGMNIGCKIEILHSSHGQGGPTLVSAGETRLAVGQGMAEKILVVVDTQEHPPKSCSFRRFRRGWFRSY